MNVVTVGLRLEKIVQSKWNTQLENVYANVIVINNETRQATTFTTSPVKIGSPFGTAALKGFIDTSDFVQDEYDLRIVIYFSGESKRFEGSFVVTYDESKVTFNSVVGITVIILSGIIIIIGIALFVLKKKKK